MFQKLEDDLKTAMLARDSDTVTTLRGLKSAIRNVEIDTRSELNEEEITAVLQKEAKKRREAIAMYEQANENERAAYEQRELDLIEKYLPAQMSEEEIKAVIDLIVSELGATTMQDMGKVMGAVSAKLSGSADGSIVAKLVKEKLLG